MNFFEWLTEDVASTESMLKQLYENTEDWQPHSHLRLILADSLQEDSRVREAEILRSDQRIALEKYGNRITIFYSGGGDIYYMAEADPNLIIVLRSCMRNRTRIMIDYGNTSGEKEGRNWLEEHNNTGVLEPRTARNKIGGMLRPGLAIRSILLPISENIIVRVRATAGGKVLYQHPNYHHGKIEIKEKEEPHVLPNRQFLTHDLTQDGETHASFESEAKARRWAKRMGLNPEQEG